MATKIPNIIKEAYYSGQILQVADFKTEQDFHIRHRHFQTQQLLSPGVLSGLEVTVSDKTIAVAAGAAIDDNGQQILLTASKTLDVNEIDGDYQLILTDAMTAVTDQPNQLKSDPALTLTAAGTPLQDGLPLANITIANGIINIVKTCTPAEILSSRMPKQPIVNLDASVINSGVFQANQIPDLQKLNGKVTTEQLPSDIGGAKDYVAFFANKTVVPSGSTILFTWESNKEVDSLELDYLSVKGIRNIQSTDGGIQLSQSDFTDTPGLTTTYTLTARISKVVVAQKQLTITVLTLKGLVERLYLGNQTADDCVAQIQSQFPDTTPQEAAIVLANAGYSLSDTGAAIKMGFNITNASEFGKIMANAFPS